MSKHITILGSGMAGCLAGAFNSGAKIIEASEEPRFNHKALLRFKTSAVSELTGIEMQRVIARKFIWDSDRKEFSKPNPMLANQYSIKVIGTIGDRSVWDIREEERYIPPKDFHERLVEMCSDRIEWGVKIEHFTDIPCPAISTIPLSAMANILREDINAQFEHKPIYVKRFSVHGEGYQTIYYPSLIKTDIYRASLSGSELIIESVSDEISPDELEEVLGSFGLIGSNVLQYATSDDKIYTQSLGKISPIDEHLRRKFIIDATKFNIYSLGRFATWRNIGLDDVIHDLAVIRRLMQSDHYEARKELI